LIPDSPLTTGAGLSEVVPSPNCPLPLSPQAFGEPEVLHKK